MGEKGDLVDTGALQAASSGVLDQAVDTATGVAGDVVTAAKDEAVAAVAGAAADRTIAPILASRAKKPEDESDDETGTGPASPGS